MARRMGPSLNAPLRGDPPSPVEPAPGPSMVWVALSGGGTRAAAFGWHVLQALRRVPFPAADGGPSNLAAEIDHISGISGGSFAAAAWCLFGPDSDEFARRFLRRNIQLEVGKRMALPWNALRLMLPAVSRSNIAAELYHSEVFGERTFADLPTRPGLRIHATNLALGARFSFTPRDFGLIGSDLGTYPLGYACAASSAFPVLLSPVTLRNHGRSLGLDELYEQDLAYEHAVDNARDDVEWHYRRLAREYYNDKANRFIHLGDGGLVDNQGLQAIIDEFDTFGLISARLDDPEHPLERLVLVNVNAGTRTDDTAGRRSRAPGVVRVMLYTMVTSMDLLSAKRWVRIREHIANLRRASRAAVRAGRAAKELKIYTVEISFRNVADPTDRDACQGLPTSFHLSPEQLDLIGRVAPGLVLGNPDVRRLQDDLAQPGA